MTVTTNDQDVLDEYIERAELLYDYQKDQYELAVDSIRRLEDKSTKMLGILSFIITVSLLVVRYWWNDIFVGEITPWKCICWAAIILFLIFAMCSWGFAFSAMIPKDFIKPSSGEDMTTHFINNPRHISLTWAANSYSDFTAVVDEFHKEKVRMIHNGNEAILFAAISFAVFILMVFIIKL
ncbi:hypothetical protein LNA51_003580 [Escherichia coli]|nr:hypothetical protein [Escherichia coli]EIM4730151.1 hypothetical protein [Escherichia coli]HCX3975825.1 hypothetical protein [Escherichia coli]